MRPLVLCVTGFVLALSSQACYGQVTMTCNPSTGPVQVGVPYSTTCTISGGTPPYSFGSAPPNSNPAGLNAFQTSATTDLTSGTPTTAGPYSFGKFGQDSAGHLVTVTFNGSIAAAGSPVFSCASGAGPVTVGQPYTDTCTGSGGTPPYTFFISGTEPGGLNYTQTGATTATIAGAPTQAGPFNYGLFLKDSTGASSNTVSFVGTITGLTMTCNPTTGPTMVGVAYLTTCTASGGVPPYTFFISGTEPAGLNYTQTGATTATVAGTPTQAGTFNYGVFFKDSTGASSNTVSFSGTIAPLAPLTFTCNPTTGPATVGTAYLTTCTATGGTPPYTYFISGTEPAGLNYTQTSATTATVAGTPTQAGPFNYGVFFKDSTGASSNTVSFIGTIAPLAPLTFTCNPSTGPTNVGTAYLTTCTASGGTPPYSFFISGTEPAGLNYTQTGATTATVAGTPTQPGAYTYGVFFKDSTGASSNTVSFSGNIAALPPLTLTCNPAAGPTTVGVAYSSTCTAAGGTAPYSFGLNPPNVIPAGLTEAQATANTAHISGTPTQTGPYSFGVFVQDATNASVTATFTGTLGNGSSGCTFSFSPSAGTTLPATGTSTVEICPNNSGQPNCGVGPETPQQFTVTPSASCGPWTAASSSPFLQITNGLAGNGTGTVTYVLLNNTHTLTQNLAITVSSASSSASFPLLQNGSGDSEVFRQVFALYEQLLGRDPDAGGFAFWTGSGGAGLGQMADSYLTSPEAFNSDFAVMAIYQAATGAPPNYNQFIAAVTALRTNNQTVPGLFNSLTPAGYSATTLYQNLLGRTPTAQEISTANAAGLASWVQTLIGFPSNSTPVFAPNNEFQSTGTFHNGLASDHTNALYVRMIYFVTVSRDPDASGLAFWTGIANNGGPGLLFQGNQGFATRIQILGPGTPNQGFIGSPEFQGLFQN